MLARLILRRNGYCERGWRRGPGPWNCTFPGCARAATSRASGTAADYRNPATFVGHRVVVAGGANSAVQIAAELAMVAEVAPATLRPVQFFPQRMLGLDLHFRLKWTRLERTRWLSDQSMPVLDGGRYRNAVACGPLRRRDMFNASPIWAWRDSARRWRGARRRSVVRDGFPTGCRILAEAGRRRP